MSIRVMLVEDHLMIRDALADVLERGGGIEIVGTAENGASALAGAHACLPDVVVLDIAMPGINGVEVAQRLRAALPQVRVLMLSGYSDKHFVQESLRAGAMGFVVKTAASTELARAIHAVAAGQHYLSPEVSAAVIGQYAPGADGAVTPPALTAREREVLRLVVDGVKTAEIARRLGISEGTVEVHRRNFMHKLDLHGIAQLTKYALREGLTKL